MKARDYINTNAEFLGHEGRPLDGDWDTLHKVIDDSKVEKLVARLYKTYGLQVSKITQSHSRYNIHMSYDDTFPVCCMYADGYDGDIDYYYVSEFNKRAKRNNKCNDNARMNSNLGRLMTAIKRVVPTKDEVNNKSVSSLLELEDVIRGSVSGGGYKSKYDITEDNLHAMMQALAPSNNPVKYEINIEELTKALKSWDMADWSQAERDSKVAKLLDEPMYALGIDRDNKYVIGQVQKVLFAGLPRCTIVSPFKRIKDLEDYPDVRAIITMLKIRTENKEKSIDFITTYAMYDEDLNVVTAPLPNKYGDLALSGDMAWLLTPVN